MAGLSIKNTERDYFLSGSNSGHWQSGPPEITRSLHCFPFSRHSILRRRWQELCLRFWVYYWYFYEQVVFACFWWFLRMQCASWHRCLVFNRTNKARPTVMRSRLYCSTQVTKIHIYYVCWILMVWVFRFRYHSVHKKLFLVRVNIFLLEMAIIHRIIYLVVIW